MGQEIYIRFLSFSSKAEFKQEVLQKCPEKIDIGAVYSGKPRMKNSLKVFKPVQRELVFDIDMTDYDDIRTCCNGASICIKCWKFMTIALKLLDYALRECFGFKHILYVYSGRRGIHCWVCDERARFLSEETRKSIVSFLEIVKGGEQKAKKVHLSGVLHPFIRSAENIIKDYFETIVLKEQDILDNPEKEAKMLEMMNSSLREDLEPIWAKCSTSNLKWEALKKMVAEKSKSSLIVTEIMFQYLYPRLDAQVSMHLNHLLKAPFVIHPKTGRVCVPIDPEGFEKFNPLEVPSVSDLIQEINDYDLEHPDQMNVDGKKLSDWKKTSLAKYIEIFDQFKAGLDLEYRNELIQKRTEEERKLQF